jgi:hypothetical protein
LRDAEYCAKRIARERVGWGNALSEVLFAGIAEVRSQPELALAHWRSAETLSDSTGLVLVSRAAAFRAALGIGGDQGASELERIRESLGKRGIREPDRICSLFAAGVALPRLRLPGPAA